MKSIHLKTPIPGPKSRALKERRDAAVPAAAFEVTPIYLARAEGAVLTDVDDNTFIDFAGGIGSLNTGQCPPFVVEAIRNQAGAYLHACFHVTGYEPYVGLAEKLNAITPGGHPKKTLLFNSGAEAIENAIKAARYFTKRQAVVAFEQGFHGRTLLGMSLTGKVAPYKKGFGPFAPEVYHLPFPNIYRRDSSLSEDAYVDQQLTDLHRFFKTQVDPDNVAAVVMELQTGEGGFIPAPVRFVQELAKLCREHGVLFVADEVQTGFARTGRMFASEHYGIVPDLMTMAKSLSGGLPLSAVTGRADIFDVIPPGGLGGTFGGNPLSCAAALASLEMIQATNLSDRAEVIGQKIRSSFSALQNHVPLIGDVRGWGAMIGIELVTDPRSKEPATAETKDIIKRCYENGLILLSCGLYGNVLRTLTPLVITDGQLDEALSVLSNVITQVAKK